VIDAGDPPVKGGAMFQLIIQGGDVVTPSGVGAADARDFPG